MSLRAGTGFYYGSRLLEPVGEKIGLSIDQINYVSCQLAAIVIGLLFRLILHPTRVSGTVRHIFEFVIGTGLVCFCFGSQVVHLYAQTLLCYLALHISPAHSHQLCFGVSILYLSVMHIYRQVYDYGGYTLDITGPLMISTQKLSDLAFCVHDGMYKEEEKLNPVQKEYALKKIPSVLAVISYILSFHNVMLGPTCFFKDYQEFIDGTNIGLDKSEYKENGEYIRLSMWKILLEKLVIAVVCVVMTIQVIDLIPTGYFRDPEYLNSGFLFVICYMLASLTVIRSKYYFAWTLGELCNIMAGFGFVGYNKDGSENWSMIKNADIWRIETCTSIKINIDSWNIRTLVWLRRVVYERVDKFPVLMTFGVSALWHGFYPGYYIAFLTGGLFINANRAIRRNIRPYFQSSKPLIILYDLITFIGTRFCCVYMVVPFVIYEFQPTIDVYIAQYFWLHILALLAVVVLPKGKSAKSH